MIIAPSGLTEINETEWASGGKQVRLKCLVRVTSLDEGGRPMQETIRNLKREAGVELFQKESQCEVPTKAGEVVALPNRGGGDAH